MASKTKILVVGNSFGIYLEIPLIDNFMLYAVIIVIPLTFYSFFLIDLKEM